MNSERLGHILLHKGLIDHKQLDFCLTVQKNNGGERIGKVLRHYDFVKDSHVAAAIAQQVGWDVHEGEYVLDGEAAEILGFDYLCEHIVFPLQSSTGPVFILSKTDDMATTDFIQSKFKQPIKFCIGHDVHLRSALEKIMVDKSAMERSTGAEDVLVWFEAHLHAAIAQGATDIHIEPSRKAIELRFRVDGILCFQDALRLVHLPRLANVIFHKAQVAVSDFNHFHDARFTHSYMNREVDVRVSHIPSIYGSSLVLRLLDKSKSAIVLTDLGYTPDDWALIQRDLVKPDGMTLVIGPTGCGKTTTLYAMLNHIKDIGRKIVTIEDPVEIESSLMSQVQINPRRDIHFHEAVRAFLRHDPDIILVGEVRDAQTAQESLRAAMTGHKVFATLHANKPLDALLRLNDLGVSWMHLASNISMIIAQRLVRRLCQACRGKGCAHCRNGFSGRTVVAEILRMDDAVMRLVGRGDMMGLKDHLDAQKDRATLISNARYLVEKGVTTMEEVARVLGK